MRMATVLERVAVSAAGLVTGWVLVVLLWEVM